ncbi:MAG: hypothetical protein U0T83_07430 [Bacteriovoracaceae bacterium]
MNLKRMLPILVSFGLTSIGTVYAGPFVIKDRTFGSAFPAALQTELNTVFNDVETQVNTLLPNTGSDTNNYAKGMADSGVMAAKGLGVDYATHPDLVILGAGVGVAGDLGGSSLSNVMNGTVKSTQIRGVGIQASLMAGVNLGYFTDAELGPIHLNKLKVFTNFLTKDLPSSGGLKGDMTDFGLHFQYDFFEEVSLPWGFIKWHGLQLTTGFEYSALDVKFTKAIDKTTSKTVDVSSVTSVTGQTATATARFNGTANVGADTSVKSIPIEISTSARILYVLTPFVGLGGDFNFGSAKTTANISGPVTITDSLGVFSTANNTNVSATASLPLDSRGTIKPDTFSARWFGGLQINIFLVKIYAQVNQSLTNDTLGVNAGLRLAW